MKATRSRIDMEILMLVVFVAVLIALACILGGNGTGRWF